jgi:predicted cobalt transporter CbtA
MSRRLKLTLIVIAFNIIGFAEGYLLAVMGLYWLVPLILVTAFRAVLLSRRF